MKKDPDGGQPRLSRAHSVPDSLSLQGSIASFFSTPRPLSQEIIAGIVEIYTNLVPVNTVEYTGFENQIQFLLPGQVMPAETVVSHLKEEFSQMHMLAKNICLPALPVE